MKFFRLLSIYDIWIIGVTVSMLALSLILISSAGAAVALSHNWNTFFFTKKHLFFTCLSLLLCLSCCTLELKTIINLGQIILLLGIIGVICTFFIGTAIKGAYRWLNILGFSLQPSELMKFGCIISVAYMIYLEKYLASILVSLFCSGLLLIQPDFGSLVLLLTVIIIIAFINGLKWIYIGLSVCFMLCTAIFAYLTLPHVVKRVDIFLQINQSEQRNTNQQITNQLGTDIINNKKIDNKKIDNKKIDKFGSSYQIIKATQAFKSGGLIGKGPGEGVLKYYLPDAHADFIFAVAGEEFGLIGNIFILILYFIFLMRMYIHAYQISRKNDDKNHLIFLIIVGLGSHILLQAWFNFLSNLALIPTKGFTLPIIGYGGSGLMASMASIGLLLNLTKKKQEQKVLHKFA